MNIVEVVHATKKYKEYTVLDDVCLEFKPGKIHGIVGRNGSGKTILFKAICGFVPLTSGKILVESEEIGKEIDVPRDVGVIIENPGFLPNASAIGNLKLLASIKKRIPKEKIIETIIRVGLDPTSKKQVYKFSLGMRQRLGIAQAIMEDPPLLILDEPFNGLDISGVKEMRLLLDELRDRGKTILMASHSQEDIEHLCDTVIKMDQGRVISVEALSAPT